MKEGRRKGKGGKEGIGERREGSWNMERGTVCVRDGGRVAGKKDGVGEGVDVRGEWWGGGYGPLFRAGGRRFTGWRVGRLKTRYSCHSFPSSSASVFYLRGLLYLCFCRLFLGLRPQIALFSLCYLSCHFRVFTLPL